MPEKHPYTTSLSGLFQVINHLRSSFPSPINSDLLKKLGYAPNNESYIIYTLRFLDIIDDEGKQTDQAAKAFTQHIDADFQKEFQKIVKEAYKDLFDLHIDKAWALDTDALITFFRQSDKSSAGVGRRQANTFAALAGIAGRRDVSDQKVTPTKKGASPAEKQKKKDKNIPSIEKDDKKHYQGGSSKREYGLTVRIEVNLPTEASQETYDKIFKSIKENLLNE
jgi:hypothetical protein